MYTVSSRLGMALLNCSLSVVCASKQGVALVFDDDRLDVGYDGVPV